MKPLPAAYTFPSLKKQERGAVLTHSAKLERGDLPARASNRTTRRVIAACLSAVVVVSLAACSSDAPAASNPSASAQGANVDAAKAAIASYTGAPSEFPVTEPFSKALDAGKKFVFLQCSSPVCAQVAKSFKQAVEAIGAEPIMVNAGATAQTAQAAASSVLAMKPDAVILSGSDPALYGNGLKALSDAGTKVVSIQVTKDVAPYGITFNYLGAALSHQNGTLLADWVIANKGAKANAVVYGVPALDLSVPMQKAFEAEMSKYCPSCEVRNVPIDVATIGTTAARTIVTDLQAHPKTNVAVFVSYQAAAGLPAAMQAAGLSVTTVGFAPTAGNLQDIKDGGLTAGLAIDFPVSIWTAVDAAARLIAGEQPTKGEKDGLLPEQFLEQKDITFDPTKGWSGYPDYVQRYAKLWKMAG